MNLQFELDKAWKKANTFPGKLEILRPNMLQPAFAAQTIIKLLQTTYADHAISRNPNKVEEDIEKGLVQPWILTRDSKPVACAGLISQGDGSAELGRAVSIESGSGAGKIVMLSAALASPNPLVAEVRIANSFINVPSGEATQRICFGILELVPHAILPAFAHGQPLRNEMFAFSAEGFKLDKNTITETALDTISNRESNGPHKKIQVVQDSPFRVAVSSDTGLDLNQFIAQSRTKVKGCTMVSIEVTDQNLSTIACLRENNFVLSGVDRNMGPSGLPVILLATLANGTLLAPTKIGNNLSLEMQKDIQNIANNFEQILERT